MTWFDAEVTAGVPWQRLAQISATSLKCIVIVPFKENLLSMSLPILSLHILLFLNLQNKMYDPCFTMRYTTGDLQYWYVWCCSFNLEDGEDGFHKLSEGYGIYAVLQNLM